MGRKQVWSRFAPAIVRKSTSFRAEVGNVNVRLQLSSRLIKAQVPVLSDTQDRKV